ncbi:sulfatase-like hydrolase/transferase [Puniceicoccales bacterium CK1056]|uniref:Sulfatase-like hydrolase/transferase n=1 Tax=Oceanipulchritudo coccoides TaxID=2706888 RepID=A0A6B2M1K5_9BACT|nr:sulfatase-like hydrolase/transferase [Oceanipulchritudo coccoides]NDV62603.1 sulfatase-like hydrolase/transferase [Oceanipulchritudo coccoides]
MKYPILITALFLAFTHYISGASESPPNLVVILADDLGYADVGFNGGTEIPTPHIDKIADQGVQFTSAYVTYPVCGPSRAGFMSGRYPQRFGFERNPQYKTEDSNMGLPLSEDTIASALQKVGYTSGIVGKWHLGAHPDLHPLNRGFDFFYGHLGGGHRYFPEELTIKDSYKARNEIESYRTWILRNHEHVKPTKYLTDAFSDAAVEFIEENSDRPFFLFLSYNAPHGPLQATEEYLARFPSIENPDRRTYAAMVSALDDGVGRVLETLAANGLDENTLVFFLSDNGGPQSNASSNAPLRGWKSDVWEGGWRVPFALRWTGQLPVGTTYRDPVSALDIFATIADLANAPINPEKPLDGVNLVPHVTGKNPEPAHAAVFLRKFDAGAYAVRRGDYKMVIPPGKEKYLGLYNVDRDPQERFNFIVTKKDVFDEIDKVRLEWESGLIEPVFLGLSQTEAWQNRLKRAREAKAKKKD